MAGDPNNVKIWAGADVLVLKPSDIPQGQSIEDMIPATVNDPFPPAWRPAGLLSGDAGFEESVEWDKTEHTAWGYGVIKIGFKDFKMERKFTTLEENPTTRYLRSKNDTATRVKVSKPAEVYTAYETRTDEGDIERLISLMPATTEYGGRTKNESDLPEVEFTQTIVPNSDKELFAVQSTADDFGLTAFDLTITMTGAPTGGTWKAIVAGQETGPLAPDVANNALKAAIEGLSTVSGTVTVTGSAGTWRVVYTGEGAIIPGDNSLTGGTNPKVTVVTTP